jgi:hypothetical protein
MHVNKKIDKFKKAFPASASKVYHSGTLNSTPPIFGRLLH